MMDLYILSDLHLGAGRSQESRRYSRLEAFFYDSEFAGFIDRVLVDSMAHRRRARLILNGDVFDFLSLTKVPSDEEAEAYGWTIRDDERKFGLDPTDSKSAWKMERILRGHPTFFAALLRFIQAGHPVTLIRGNHDPELFWPEVRDRLFSELAVQAKAIGLEELTESALRDKITIEQWFYLEPGRIYVEHGNQYEPTNSFRFNLHPVLPNENPEETTESLDYPTGSLFVRYMFNKMKQIDPFSTFFITLDSYFTILRRASFLDIARTLTLHFPFFLRTIRDARFFELHGMEEVTRTHEQSIQKLAEEKSLPLESVQALDDLMVEPLGKTKYSLLQEMLRPIVGTTLRILTIALISLCAWFFLFTLIQSTGRIAEGIFVKASLLAILSVITVVGIFFVIMNVIRRVASSHNAWSDPLYRKAERIAELMDVPLVSMGHTHRTDLRPFRHREGFFANSGTWIISTGPWDVVRAKSQQFTFVRVRDMDMDILRWDHTTNQWEPVPLMEDYQPTAMERLIQEDDSGFQ
jgi:UDP-2,3-diacylglucosamine pyrophosphatase LpxH